MITIHTYGLANHLLKNHVPMKEMAPNKKEKNNGLVFYFEDNKRIRQLMKEYSRKQ
ncbi:DUF5659 domain-containing protein [Priestia aryabhattai]|uniref:DUF5659 domain-containing protein n=1 Tax=Priestia aryabhattai TaxID=412384 RepID=UPI002E1E7E08|nr:DUF5659 domain-containing protein [Priestia aryabhattai]